jgi:hypothetical protein
MTHVAYNTTTKEIITSNCGGNTFKRMIAHRTATEKSFGRAISNYRWVFAHGGSFEDCMAKLVNRGYGG